jgi:hypothetical protein
MLREVKQVNQAGEPKESVVIYERSDRISRE